MSATAAAITLIIVAIIYVGVIFLSRQYNHGGRDPVDPLYSVSQWNPTGWRITSTCRIPPSPGFCVIEGLTGAYQDGTRWCDVTTGTCIDPNTGENVKGTAIPFIASCPTIPFCGWSECVITFDADLSTGAYLKVSTDTQKKLIAANQGAASKFYMQRLSVSTSLIGDQNGTLTQFYYLADDGTIFILGYNNNASRPGIQGLTALIIQPYNQGHFNLPSIFVLMETMPTTISSSGIAGPAPSFVARKILAFSGQDRTSNPGLDVLQAFNPHVQTALWQAALKYKLICIFYKSQWTGFYGDPTTDFYFSILENWNTSLTYNIIQDAVESRLLNETGVLHRPFYNWIG